MGRKKRDRYQLYWNKPRKPGQSGRWSIKYQGKWYYPGGAATEGKVASYQRCWREWLKMRADIDASDTASHRDRVAASWAPIISAVRESQGHLIDVYGDTEETREVWQALERRFMRQLIAPAIAAGEGPSDLGATADQVAHVSETLQDAYPQLPAQVIESMKHDGKPLGATVDYATGTPPWDREQEADRENITSVIDEFIGSVRAKGRSERRLSNIRKDVDRYVEQLPSGVTIADVADGRNLGRYFDSIRQTDLADSTKRDRINHVAQLIKWLFKAECIPALPPIIAAGDYTHETAPGEIEIYTDDEIREILSAASGRARLYVLLALNCGMTQVDISDMRHDEVDMKAGTVTRKRSKTKRQKTVPTVTYKLWPETLELLRKHATTEGDRVLTNAAGNPLVTEGRKADSVAKAMQTLRANMKRKKPITFKRFRSTAATKLAGQYPEFEDLFLGHSPKTTAQRHYVRPNQERFDEAVSWLRDTLGIEQACS